MRRLVLTLFALLIAGCVDPEAASGTGSDAGTDRAAAAFPWPDPIEDFHDHSNATEHARWTPTMERLGYHPLGPDGMPYNYVGEITAWEDYAFVAIEGGASFGEPSGFVVLDISDPRNPEVLARASAPFATAHDIKVDPTGNWLYQGSQAWYNRPIIDGSRPLEVADQNGVLVWDVRDKAAPRPVSFSQVPPNGCHMVSVAVLDGETFVYCATNEYYLRILKAVDGPRGRELVTVGSFIPETERNPATRAPGPHDMTFQMDPLTGEPILVVSYVNNGVYLLSLKDPANPQQLGNWAGEGARHWHGQTHSAMAYAVGDRRIIVLTPELYSEEVPALHFLDATDPARMTLVTEWTAPGDHGAGGFKLTTHQIQIVDGRLYLAYNHAGVWVLDVGTEESLAEPRVLGYYLPHEQPWPADDPTRNSPFVWDVVVHRGVILASDRQTGFFTLHFEGDAFEDAVSSFA